MSTCWEGPHLFNKLSDPSRVGGLEHAQYGSLDVQSPHLLSSLRAQGCDLSTLKQEPQGLLLQRLSTKTKTPDGP